MGRDTGIRIISQDPVKFGRGVYMEFLEYEYKDTGKFVYEVAYFRKVHGLAERLSKAAGYSETDDCCIVDIKTLIRFRQILKYFNKRDNFDEDADSAVFTFDELKESLKDAYKNVEWLIDDYPNHPKYDVVFYDSY